MTDISMSGTGADIPEISIGVQRTSATTLRTGIIGLDTGAVNLTIGDVALGTGAGGPVTTG